MAVVDTRQQHDKCKEVRIQHDNDISIVCVYLTGVPTLCNEMPRWPPENQRESSKPGSKSSAGRSLEASLIPKLYTWYELSYVAMLQQWCYDLPHTLTIWSIYHIFPVVW